MIYWVYILQSQLNDSFYKGHTDELLRRIEEHNSGKVTYTRKFIPWDLVWYTSIPSKTEAYELELKLKNLSNKRTIDFIKKYPPQGSITITPLRVQP
jgi:putative endonuclease